MGLKIIKIGGQVINEEERLQAFLGAFAKLEGPKILVHGGGRKATKLSKRLGIHTKIVEGRRVTDAQTLEVATMVYGGLVNKNLVAKLQGLGLNTLGMCGADLNSIQSHKRINTEVDFGFVGDIDQINGEMITKLLHLDITPVFCALTHDNQGQLLNTNADSIASKLAIGLKAHFESVELYFCFEKNGVLFDVENDFSVIPKINAAQYQQYKKDEIISGGMIPKIDNAFEALEAKVSQVYICSAEAVIENNFVKATQLIL